DSGVHICLRATDTRAVEDFHAAALNAGGTSDGAPGPRTEYHSSYYAAFVRDPDGNRIEAVTFLREAESKYIRARRELSFLDSRFRGNERNCISRSDNL